MVANINEGFSMSFKEAFLKQLSLESQVSTTGREDELVIYAQINDFEGLKKADSKESQEQWQIDAVVGKLRVRKTTKDGLDPTFTMAIKYKDSTVLKGGNIETEFDITSDAFDAFKSLSQKGMVKDRYVFKTSKTTVNTDSGKQGIAIPDLAYEVDVFHDGNGGYHKWCKIDLELNKLLDEVESTSPGTKKINLTVKVTDLPIQLSGSILSTSEKAEDKAMITKLYDDYFLTINERAKPKAVVTEPESEIIPEATTDETNASAPATSDEAASATTDDVSATETEPESETTEKPVDDDKATGATQVSEKTEDPA